jgi:hypothetical protein
MSAQTRAMIVGVVWPAATVQLCVVHLIRASLRYASKRDWTPLTKDLRLIYTAADDTAAEAALDAFAQTWSTRYPTIVNLWRSHWAEFVPFLAVPARGPPRHLHDEPDRVDERPTPKGHSQPRPVPDRAGRAQSALPRRPQPRRVPQPERRDEKFGLETSAPSVHDLLRGTHPHTMTATITYTDGLTLPSYFDLKMSARGGA